MKTLKSALVLTAAAAALAFAAAPTAFAGPQKPKAMASPAQPIPYSQLDAYRRATPSQRTARDWSAGVTAETGVIADTSANVPAVTQPAAPSPSTAPSDLVPENITPPVGVVGDVDATPGTPGEAPK